MKTNRVVCFIILLFIAACSESAKDSGRNNLKNDTLTSVDDQNFNDDITEVDVDLPHIRKRGVLRAITIYSSTSFFLYRGKPMGYEYELVKRLADHLKLDLEIVVAKNLDHLFTRLYQGDGDIITYGLTITKERREKVAFTKPHHKTHQVLIQRKPENWRSMKLHEIDQQLIRDPLDLIGKKVYVRENSSYYERLENLSDEIGGDIDIVTVPGNTETEELIRQVAKGKIDYTIADENIAKINSTYYTNIDLETAVSFNQRVAWVVRKNSPQLLKAVNSWISGMKKETDYYVIYNKYFKNKKDYKRRVKSDFYSIKGNKISKYDTLIKKYARRIDWDWKLLASLIYQESKWDADITSWAGAVGLMQVMPLHADNCGANDLTKPPQNIECGVSYIETLQDIFKDIPDKTEKKKFVLASYNVGQNHVHDAQRLAKKHGKDPNVWTHETEEFILKLSKPEYYNDDVVKYGYCRGDEPYNYVKEILERYGYYEELLDVKQ